MNRLTGVSILDEKTEIRMMTETVFRFLFL